MAKLEGVRKKLGDSVPSETFDRCVAAWEEEAGDDESEDEDAFVHFLWSNGVVDQSLAAELSSSAISPSATLSAVHVNFGGPKLPAAQAGADGDDGISTGDAAVDATVDLQLPAPGSQATVIQEGAVAQLPLPPGLRRHSILSKVGEGGMGSVFLARDANLRRKVALKQQDVQDLVELKQFTLEAQITAQLEHPHVVPVYAFEATTDGRVAYTMKMVEGQGLDEVIEAAKHEDDPRAGLARRLDLFLQICSAIDYAHAKGVLHRDLKPANVMIGPFNELYVLDWGLSKLIGHEDLPPSSRAKDGSPSSSSSAPELSDIDVDDPATRTIAGTLKGTPLYMAPEQAIPKPEQLGPHSDQFALGLILYELVNLRRAYPGKSLRDVLATAREGRIQPPDPEIDPPIELSAIIGKATAFAPEDRYRSVRALAKDVRRYLRNEETRALPDDLYRKVRRWMTRHPQQAMGVVGLLLLLGVVSVVAGVARHRVALAQERLRSERQAESQRQLVGLVSARVQDLDRDALGYRGLTEGLARAASLALQHGQPSDAPLHGTDVFSDPARQPEGMLASDHYGKPIHPWWPVHRWGPEVDPGVGERDARKLVPLRFMMRELYRGDNVNTRQGERADDAALSAQIAAHSVPIEWAYVATESGVIVLFPGAQDMGWDASYDPRKRSWYREAKQAFRTAGRTRQVSRPYLDGMGQGLVLTFTQAILDDDGEFLGVAALDLGLSYVSETYLTASELPGFRRSFILTATGEVLLSSDSEITGQAGASGALELPAFPHDEQLFHLLDERSGLVRAGNLALAWSRTNLGTVFVVEAEASALFEAGQ